MLTNKTRHVSFKDTRNQLYDPLIILQKDKILSDFKDIYYVDQKRQQALFDAMHNFLLTHSFSFFVFLLFPSSDFIFFSSQLPKYISTHIMLFHSIKQQVIILSTTATSCRQTFEAAIPPSCLVIADHLSAGSVSATWIHWNVINFACKKGDRQQTTFTSCQSAACSNEVSLCWVYYTLER